MGTKSHLEQQFQRAWELYSPLLLEFDEPQQEHRFDPSRRWRFDFAWPLQRVAVEIEGGTWSGGRHSRGAGMTADAEKYNAAAALGWRIVRFTADMLRDDPAGCVQAVINALEWTPEVSDAAV